MEDLLNDTPTNNAPVDMSELVELNPPSNNIPTNSVRNRAATTAVLSGEPEKMVEKYRLLMEESAGGSEVSQQQAMDALTERNRTKSMKHVINLLGDQSIPLEQKKQLMKAVQENQFKDDPANHLRMNALEAPSAGEDLRGEAARISLADTMQEVHAEAEDRQRLLNGAMAQLDTDDLAKSVGDMAAADVMPFGRNIINARVAAKVNENFGEDTPIWSWVKNLLLPGSTADDIQKRLMNTPPAQRGPITLKLLDAVKNSAAVFPNENYYAQYKTATRLLEDPMHDNTDVWVENVTTVLDAFWVGSEVKSLNKAAQASSKARAASGVDSKVYKADWELVDDTPRNPFAYRIGTPKTQLEDKSERILLGSVVHRENPVAPYNIIAQANPADARAIHESIRTSGSDELAEALTGTTREQALINNTFPQVGSESGAVFNKVNQEVKDAITNTGATRYTPVELESAVATVTHDFRNASGLEVNDAMTTIRVDGDHLVIDAHYSPVGGAFTTPEGAKAQAEFALRSYGIREDEIVVMKRKGSEYVPVGPEDTKPGDYIIKVKSRQPIRDSQVDEWSVLDVKRNWTDRISWTGSEDKGSIANWIFDPGSMLHPTITGSASIATDQAVALENLFLKPIKDFRNVVSSFPADRRMMVEDFIKEANTKGLKTDRFDLVARGFKEPEIKALEDWKKIWDTHFYIENYDLIRTLDAQGFQVFDNAGTKLFGKSVGKNQNIARVYDPASDSIIPTSVADMDSLYNQGGTYASLRRPIEINGLSVDHMIIRNTPNQFMRKLRDTDSVLNYREGYYTVSYNKGSKFVDEITYDSSGKEVRRTVAVAGNTSDAKTFADSAQSSTGNLHVIREDSRGFAKDGDGYWDVNNASGRIAQRVRGKPLVSATGINQLGSGTFIDNPMESAARAARSLAGRTTARPMLETAKARFMKQFGDMIEPKNGQVLFPSNRSEIVDAVSHASSRVADARTTYGYIKYLEDGYINTADQWFKGGMRAIEDMLAHKGFTTLEKVAQKVGDIAPSHAAKSVVFHAYIVGANPVRQWIVQSHQATRMAAYNPIGVANGGMHKRMIGYIGEKTGFKVSDAEIKSFTKFVDDSGMVAGVDRNSLVRGLKLSMADSSSKIKRVAGHLFALPQTVGFDIGEKINQLGHLAAVHEKYTRAGKNLADKTVRDIALTEARALSGDLNRAGELAYTQSTPALILQFLQMPQKSLLLLTNRKIPFSISARIAAWDMLMWGVGGGAVYSIVSEMVETVTGDPDGILPDDPDNREKFLYGLESFYMNKAITMMDDSGETSRIDFSALSPNDMDGWARMYHALMEDGVYGAFAASPAGQLMAIDGVNGSRRNGRIPKALITMGRYFNVIEEFDPENPTEFSAVLNDVAKITSGWTSAQNAKLLLETRKKMDASGNVVDNQVTIPEAWAAGLGFGTLSTKELYRVSQSRAKDKKAHEEDVMKRYRDILNYYTENVGAENTSLEHIQKVSSMLMRTFDDPVDQALVNKQWKKDMAGKDMQLLKRFMEAADMPNSQRLRDDIKMMPTDDQTKALLLQRLDDMQSLRKAKKEDKEK